MTWFWWCAYAVATLALLAFGIHAFVLLAWRRRHRTRYLARLDAARATSELGRTHCPTVLVQLPVYDEPSVVVRAMNAAAALDWPRDRFCVQVLDDSSDDSRERIDAAAARLRAAGTNVDVLRRTSRDGFKAGALAAGLRQSDAEFVAVFDADFVPPTDFLRRALPLMDAGARVGCVQGRWGHLNREQNWLTRAQATAVDAHFHVQQLARAASGRLLNFNGTAGIWRRTAIDDAGGWSGATLTEDLELSYRAQLRGWRIVFDPDLVVPAELPPTLAAYKSQQQRWACGSMQCARRFLVRVWRSELDLASRIEATFHLCGYGVCVAVLMLTLLLPFGIGHLPLALHHSASWALWALIWVAGIGPICVTREGQRADGRPVSLRASLATTLLGLGTAANNAVAALRGLALPIPTFVRTPKRGDGPAVRTEPPRIESALAVSTLVAAASLAPTAPASIVAYTLFCASGYWTLAAYWWRVERLPS